MSLVNGAGRRRATFSAAALLALVGVAAPAYAWDDNSAAQIPVHAGVWTAPEVSLTATSDQRADASWAPLGDSIEYTAQQRINGGPWTPLVASKNSAAASAPGGSKVDVRVAGQVNGQPGPFGEASTVLPIYPPAGLDLTFSSPTAARAAWGESSGATRYRLEYALDGGTWQLGRHDGDTSSEWTVHSGQQVAVRVRADNGTFFSRWSDTVTRVSPFTSSYVGGGALDSAQRSGSNITFTGWAFDQDGTVPTQVHVYVVPGTDGSNIIGRGVGYGFMADQPRPDVAAAFPGMGPNHGYSITVPAAEVPSTACAFVIDHTTSNNPPIWCQTL